MDLHIGIDGRRFRQVADAPLDFHGLFQRHRTRPRAPSPSVGGMKQVSTRMVVVFPAPLGPRNPTIWPFSTSKGNVIDRDIAGVSLGKPFDFDHIELLRTSEEALCEC